MPEDFGQRLPYVLRRLSHTMSQQLERTLRQFSLSHAQLAALAQLGLEHPGALAAADLGHRAGVTAQSMSTAVASLLDRGLVVRMPSPTHGRRLDLRITPAGVELLNKVQPATNIVEARAMAALTAQEQEELRNLLRRMMQTLDLYLPDPAP